MKYNVFAQRYPRRLIDLELHNGQRITMTLSIGFALTWEHATAEKLQELADRNMYQAKHRRAERSLN